MSTYFSPGSMANLSYDARETDFRIRVTLGLPMVDDAGDFLGEFVSEIESRDEEITDLREKVDDAERDYVREVEEHTATRRELAAALAREVEEHTATRRELAAALARITQQERNLKEK